MYNSNQIKHLFFVSEIRSPDCIASSTHLMTESILRGIKDNGIRVTLFAICIKDEEITCVKNYFSNIVDDIIVLKNFYGIGLGKYNKFNRLLKLIKSTFFLSKYKKEILQSITVKDKPDLILSHTPSFEAVPYCIVLKKLFGDVPYYQYWSDPIALSGIIPEKLNYKRIPFYFAEKRALNIADEIIYGTKTLFDFNSALFRKQAYKMRYVDIAYINKSKLDASQLRSRFEFIYAGNYYSETRNILPLYEAFNELGNEFKLHIYGGSDFELKSTDNITVNKRISPKDLEKTEASFVNNICLLNHSCIQIPGKLFYQTDTNQNTLVIADGIYANKIIEYLNTYNRFVICNNSKEEIVKAIKSFTESDDYSCPVHIKMNYSPKKISADIVGGSK